MAVIKLPAAWQDWRITEEIGEGAYGRVYRAEKENGGVKAVSAIKVIQVPSERSELLSLRRESLSDDELRRNLKEMVDEYTNEIRAMYLLQGHSHLVSIQDHLVEELDDGFSWRIYIRMEYLQSFDDYAMTHTFSREEIIRLGISLCEALRACAEHGILHRDIKPENLFVTESGQYKLGDFGIAKVLDRTVSSYSSKGTFSYMAPEVFQGKPYDSRADLYSTGIFLYKLMNRNRDPFIDPEKQIVTYQDREQAMSRRLQGERLPAPADADGNLSKVILKACEFKPINRYDSPDAMMKDLNALLRQEEAVQRPRWRWILPVCAAAVLLVAGAAAVISRTAVHRPDGNGTVTASPVPTKKIRDIMDEEVTARFPETGDQTKTEGGLTIDYSHMDQGYVMVRAQKSDQRMKLTVEHGADSLTYSMNNDEKYETIPLQYGSGEYTFSLGNAETADSSQYKGAGTISLECSIPDENSCFLYPNQYVSYSADSPVIEKARELCKDLNDPVDIARVICGYIEHEFVYDFVKFVTTDEESLPDIETTWLEKKGTEKDLSAVTCAMLRSRGVPAKLVIGTVDDSDNHTISGTKSTAWVEIITDGEILGFDPAKGLMAHHSAGWEDHNPERFY